MPKTIQLYKGDEGTDSFDTAVTKLQSPLTPFEEIQQRVLDVRRTKKRQKSFMKRLLFKVMKRQKK